MRVRVRVTRDTERGDVNRWECQGFPSFFPRRKAHSDQGQVMVVAVRFTFLRLVGEVTAVFFFETQIYHLAYLPLSFDLDCVSSG
jgi:hypothetical protein